MSAPLTDREIRDAFAGIRYDVSASQIVSQARRRQHRRRVALVALPAAGLLAAGGYVVTQREVNTRGTLACASQFSQTSDMTILGRVEGETPTETCIKVMTNDPAWTPAPANPIQCVTNYPNGDGGALLVVPAPQGMTHEDACRSIGAALPPEDSP
jgi:hypothetical protein